MDGARTSMGWLALLAAFVVGGASGFTARVGLEREPRRGGGELDVVLAGLTELRSALARLEAELVEPERLRLPAASSSTPAREPQLPQGESLDLAELSELVARFERAARASATRAEGLTIPEGRPQPVPGATSGRSEFEALNARYRFWTCQQVLDAFGRPDNTMYTAEVVLWQYRRDPNARGWFSVKLRDGLVVGVESN